MKQRTPDQQKIGDYFAACMDTSAIDRRGYEPIKPGLARIDAIERRDRRCWRRSRHCSMKGAGSYFFGSGTGQDALDSSRDYCGGGRWGAGAPGP